MTKCNSECNEDEEVCLDCPCYDCTENETCEFENNDDCGKW